MADPMKIRATLQGDTADVRILMRHPMETGTRRTAAGLVPLHFIQSVVIQHNGKTVLDAQWSQAISRDPFLGVRVKGAKAGDKISVTWTDNKGDTRTDDVAVTAGTYRTALADLNMRAGSDATTYIVAVVPAGATVVVLQDYTENGYVYVRYGGYEGYVLANLLG